MGINRVVSPQVGGIGPFSSDLKDNKKDIKKNHVLPVNISSTAVDSGLLFKAAPWVDFRKTFGAFGPVLVTTVLISIAWTTWLVILAIEPNATANYLMNTREFDNGQFWLIVDPDYSLKVLSVIGLVTVDICYVLILIKLISCRHQTPNKDTTQKSVERFTFVYAIYGHIKAVWKDVVGIRGNYRKFWNLGQKVGDLTVQTIVLGQLLQDGSSTLLVMGYTICLCANALSVAVGIMLSNHSALLDILVDSAFDMITAVLYPILVMLYSANRFDFDRELFSINIEILPHGSFERNARLFSDPAERVLFVASLDSLRILSFADLVLRLSMNFSFCLRFITVINLLVETAHTQHFKQSTWEALAQIFQQQRRAPKSIATIFVAFGIAVVAYTHKSIADSQAACAPYPECVVYAYQWGAGEMCPCRTLVDINRTPRMLEEWTNPIDVFKTVRTLSRAGMLQNIQLINRRLTRLPDELRTCKKLQYLSLIYTETQELPEWAKEWTNLQFLHIEGKQLRSSLTYLPEEIFSKMPYLQMMHLGGHAKLPRVPPLDGVPNLQSLTLAALYSVTELPSFKGLHNLQHLALPYLESLQTLPDLAPLQNLIDFIIFSITPICCNGFMGKCDPTDWFCEGNAALNVAPSQCLAANAPQPTAATQEMFTKFTPTLCLRSGFDISRTVDYLTPSMVEVCGGVPYRRCEYPPASGHVGICMNNRLQVLMCMVNDDYIRLRKVQIQRKRGPPCDVVEEAWLGCGL